MERWEAERQATFKRLGYMREYGCPKIPKWEERFQGRLAVRLEEVRVLSDERWWGEPIRRSFADGKKQDLVAMIPRILATVAAIAVAKRDNRGVEERRRLAEEAARRERERVARINTPERGRIALFEELVSEHQRLLQFEACLDALERHAPAAEAPRGLRPDCDEFPVNGQNRERCVAATTQRRPHGIHAERRVL